MERKLIMEYTSIEVGRDRGSRRLMAAVKAIVIA